MSKSIRIVPKYNIGEVWWVQFPFQDRSEVKRRPAIIIDDNRIAILSMYVSSKSKDTPYSIAIEDWEAVGLKKPSWARIDRIVQINEWNIEEKIGELSERDRIKILQLTAEYLSETTHEFSIIAIKNSSGDYLQIFDKRWGNWLFPYIASSDNNKADVDKYVSRILQEEVSTSYVTVAKHCKYSESDRIYKIYNHKLYTLDVGDDFINSVDYDGIKAKWMAISDLESDSSIMEINEDIIAFVKSNC